MSRSTTSISAPPAELPVPPNGRFIRQLDGPSLHFTQRGSSELLCVLVHGYSDGGFVWDSLAEQLALHFEVVAPDLRGHGDSGQDELGRYRLENYSADVMSVIAVFPGRPLVLIGHSLGAEIVIQLSRLLRRRVIASVLVDFGPETDSSAAQHVHDQMREAMRAFASHADFVEWLKARRPLADEERLRAYAQCALRNCGNGFELKVDPRVVQEERIEVGNDRELWDHLASISHPTLIIRGSGSAVLSRDTTRRMLRVLARGELITIPGAGHSVMIDNPTAFNSAVMGYLARIITSARTTTSDINSPPAARRL